MLINFFKELFYLDRTRDGNFFFCYVKSKHEESYIDIVPVFALGDHPVVGTDFIYEALKQLADVQLPISTLQPRSGRKKPLSAYWRDLRQMEMSGIGRSTIAEICDVTKGTITKILDRSTT
jgi:hypothetical protein